VAINVGTAVAYLDLNMTAFNSGLQQAQSALQTFGKDSSTMGQNLMSAGGLVANTGSMLTRSITVPLVSAGQEVVEFGATFDKQMSAVEAVMQSVLHEGDMDRLRESAMYWGEQTVYSATEAAEALYYMGLAGWDVDQAINGLGSVLNLAAAGNMDLGRASDVVTDSMTAMNLVAGQTTNGIENTAYYTSVLAAVMANSNTDIDKLGESFKYVAPIAGSLGYDIQDLGLALGLAANAGIKSSQAGTSLRQALKNLISPTSTTQAAMEKYGLSLYDATGQAIPFRELMIQLQATFGDLSVDVFDANGELKEGEQIMQEYGDSLPITQQEKLKAIVDLFGTRAMPTMLAIINQAGPEFDKLAGYIDEAAQTGEYAAEMAHTQMDNLQGDWVRFTSALGTTKIMLADIVKGELREFIQKLTELVKQFNELDESQKEQIIKWGLFAAAIGPVLLVLGNLLKSIGLIMESFKLFQPLIKGVSALFTTLTTNIGSAHGIIGILKGGISALTSTMAGWVAIIAVVIAAIIDLWQNNEEFRENVTRIWNAIVEVLKAAWDFVKPIFDMLIEIFHEIVKAIEPIIELLAEILAPIIEVIAGLIKTVFQALSPLIEIIGTTLVAAIKILGTILKGVVTVLRPILEVIAAILEAVAGLANILVNVLGAAFGVVADLWKKMWDGLFDIAKSIWEKLTNWFKNTWLGKILTRWGDLIKNSMNGIADMFKNGDFNLFDGSHANGLAYVPYDGYVAELHKGERVLTAQENQRYSSTSGNGTTINFYSNERIDEYTAAQELRRTMKDIELGLV